MQGDVMTKELQDAIRHIKTRADAWAVKEIEDALKQEPCDAISREDKKHINGFKYWCETNEENGIITIPKFVCDEIVKILDMLPSVQPIREIKPKEEMTVEETISDLIWLLGSNLLDKDSEDTVLNAIYHLENQPSRKGHWIDADGNTVKMIDGVPQDSCWCSECKEWLVASDEYSCKGYYCPNCDADMRESEVSE